MNVPAGPSRTPTLIGHKPVEEILTLDPRNEAVLLAALTYELIARQVIAQSAAAACGVVVHVRVACPQPRAATLPWSLHLLLTRDSGEARGLAWHWAEPSPGGPGLGERLCPAQDISVAADLIAQRLYAELPDQPARG